MGLISNLIAYKVGKRSGRSPEANKYAHDSQCIHYSVCESEGGCADRACEYEEEL
jgi:hypothetical protein